MIVIRYTFSTIRETSFLIFSLLRSFLDATIAITGSYRVRVYSNLRYRAPRADTLRHFSLVTKSYNIRSDNTGRASDYSLTPYVPRADIIGAV
jgi:hypothetical protein